MKCLYCKINDAIKYSKYSNGNFCCRKHARAYSTNKVKEKRKEISIKVSNTLKKKYKDSVHPLKNRTRSDETKTKIQKSFEKRKIEKLKFLHSNVVFELWPKKIRVGYIFKKFENTCQECGYNYTDENGKGPFEIHHIDGNHYNNVENNLTLLCLNCHWKTPNWRFRGKKHSDESKMKISKNNFNKK